MLCSSRFAALPRRFVSLLSIVLVATAFVVLTGCDKNRDDDGPATVSANYSPDAAARPPELVESYNALQSGQHAQAFSSAQGYLQSQPNGPYRAEALFLCGRSSANQGNYEGGKKYFEDAIDTAHDRNLKALAMLGRADCNYGMEKYSLASRQYHWLETMYKDVKPLHQDEVMFKLGMASKKAGNQDWANYWFNQVNELYHTGPYAERARAENTNFTPPANSDQKPLVYSLEAYVYDKSDKAENAAAMLRSKGYRDVEVKKSTRNSLVVYEVHTGKFTSRNEAGRAQVDAKLAGLDTEVRPMTVEPIK